MQRNTFFLLATTAVVLIALSCTAYTMGIGPLHWLHDADEPVLRPVYRQVQPHSKDQMALELWCPHSDAQYRVSLVVTHDNDIKLMGFNGRPAVLKRTYRGEQGQRTHVVDELSSTVQAWTDNLARIKELSVRQDVEVSTALCPPRWFAHTAR